ncbi:unnamed protein product [Didymodactylos carnosus]|uniref:Nuclear receptor domain-containing protein n=1 Tax=Didymodactylos carnosus TaxID=1234261 RepID=A0A813ZTP0_9BILA|nr:unnamed protein product [Didymodactylos carnosus]CAF0903115.1 unnamed protein product [Didymodactylos carnosus]CAF3619009.1 unnamed protein product [Didymodactylos carnosus]CAF3685322.1 unnamed protein product [Didymodactylos carnosus]
MGLPRDFEDFHQFEMSTCLSEMRSKQNEEEQCQICGDTASGWHCGAITCEACKKFFLRSITTGDGRKKYKCQRDQCCLINKRSRTQCQFCRFQKCLKAGMKPHDEHISPKTEDLYKKLPCLVCGSSASGIHFGAVTCEACKGFFRRSIKENAPDRYRCAENNNCEINSTSKITCRACRFRKCINAGMSMDASRIGRQSNLFKQNILLLHKGNHSMASINDSARIATLAKKRKTKARNGRIFASNNEIDSELTDETKEYIRVVHSAYIEHLKSIMLAIHLQELPRCTPRETVWLTMATQLVIYAQSVMSFCQKTIHGFSELSDPYEILSSSIHSVIMITLLPRTNKMLMSWNYWRAETTLANELNSHVSSMNEAEDFFRSFETKLRDLQLDEKENALLLLMCLTRTNMSVMNGENTTWPKSQLDCVQAFSDYTQARRGTNGELPVEFYEIAFLISQLRTLNRKIGQCLATAPWPFVRNLPSFFYRIYVPNISSTSKTNNQNSNHQNNSNSNDSLVNNHNISGSLNGRTIVGDDGRGQNSNSLIKCDHHMSNYTDISMWATAQSWYPPSTVQNNRQSSSSSSSSSYDDRLRAAVANSDDLYVTMRW